MTSCPACGNSLEEPHPSECPSCGARLDAPTESFAPVVQGLEEELDPGSDPGAQGAVLVVRKGPDVGERFFIDRPRLTVGRDPGRDIFLNDITVSRNHAAFDSAAGEVSVTDAGSLNGTYVNGVRVDKAILRDGDLVQIGRFQMLYMDRGGS